MSKRTVGILVLLAVVGFYALGTGFPFFYRLLYAILLLLGIGLVWSWVSLRGLEVQLHRTSTRGQVGSYMEGRVRIANRFRLPKSWLEVAEVTDLPGYSSGRGVALVRDQSRTWHTNTYLSRRGVFRTGQIEVTGRDPFGLFQMRRRFLEPRSFTVFPATQPLPDLDPRVSHLPSDSRVNRRTDAVTPDFSSVREYVQGDSFRRIHWPYTARMNTLMVKEFDQGLSAEAWVLPDMERRVHVGDDPVDNTEELVVTTAASLVSRLVALSVPVGLAANGDQTYILRPDSNPAQEGRLLGALAEVHAEGATSLERFIYELQPHLSRFNSLTVITPSVRTEWVHALVGLQHHGVNVAVVFIDPRSFDSTVETEFFLNSLLRNEIPVYVVRRGQPLNEALHYPVIREPTAAPVGSAQAVSTGGSP